MKRQITDSEIQRDIGRRIRAYRLQQNIAVEELARQAGLSKTTVTKMETGADFRLSSLIQVLRVLDRLDALQSFLPTPIVSPLSILQRPGFSPRKRAYRRRTRVSDGRLAHEEKLRSLSSPPGEVAPIFESGTGIARIGVPSETGPQRHRKNPVKVKPALASTKRIRSIAKKQVRKAGKRRG